MGLVGSGVFAFGYLVGHSTGMEHGRTEAFACARRMRERDGGNR
jgi:hypothetical protein